MNNPQLLPPPEALGDLECIIHHDQTSITLNELIHEPMMRAEIFARAEYTDPDPETCCVEICRWNLETQRWSRWASISVLSGTLLRGLPSEASARIIADAINTWANTHTAQIAFYMPVWTPDTGK